MPSASPTPGSGLGTSADASLDAGSSETSGVLLDAARPDPTRLDAGAPSSAEASASTVYLMPEAGALGGDGVDGAGAACDPALVWRPAELVTVVDPVDFGAVADDEVDDSAALEAAVAALPDLGGVVYFSPGTYLKQQRLWTIARDHVLLWAPNGQSTLHGTVRAQTQEELDDTSFCGPRQQGTIFQRTQGGGVHGLRFSSDAHERLSCAESNQIVADGVDGFEVVGVEIAGSSGTGIFTWSSASDAASARNLRFVGNYVHHTYADSIHHTDGTRRSWVWANTFFNEAPSLGDDGIACVTYGIGSPRCGEMEWWGNHYLGGAHGRGMAVIGGEDIAIHHNWIIGSASAGLIVASEPSYDTESSARIELRENWLLRSPSGAVDNGHSAILISGKQDEAEPIRDVTAQGNVIVEPFKERVERAEGRTENVVFDDQTDAQLFPSAPPTLESVELRDTRVLNTWDTSFVPEEQRRGLYRVQLQQGEEGGLFERFEYVVTAPKESLDAWLASLQLEDCSARVERSQGAEQDWAWLLSSEPLQVPQAVTALSFEDLRRGDRDASLSELWQRLDAAALD